MAYFFFLFNFLFISFSIHLFSYLLIHSFMCQFINFFIYSGLTIKCYTGSRDVKSNSSSYVAEQCTPGRNVCFTAQLTNFFMFVGYAVTVKKIQGIYINVGQCKNYCNVLKSLDSYISSCAVSNIRSHCL